MFEALITVITAVGATLQTYRNLIYEPSRNNLQSLLKDLEDLEGAYQQFDLQMSKAEYQLKYGDLGPLRHELSQFQNAFDEAFSKVIAKGNLIAREIELRGTQEQIEAAIKILEMSKYAQELWMTLSQAILHQEARHIRRLFAHVRSEMQEFVRGIKHLVQTSADSISTKIRLFPETETQETTQEHHAAESKRDAGFDQPAAHLYPHIAMEKHLPPPIQGYKSSGK